MTVRAPASSAAAYGATCTRRSSASSTTRVALVHSVPRPAVPNPVFRARQDAATSLALLQPPHDPSRVRGHQSRVLRVALVGPPPARIPRHRQRRREGPVHPRRPHLPSGDPPDPLDQIRIARRAQPDVVGEDRGAEHVGVAVNGVHAVEWRNRQVVRVLLHRRHPVRVVHRHPVGRPVVARTRSAAAQHRTDVVPLHLLRTGVEPLRLRHLPDLLIKAHAREELLHPLGDRCARRVRRAREPAHEGVPPNLCTTAPGSRYIPMWR